MKWFGIAAGVMLLATPPIFAATISGKVLWSGTAPERKPLDMRADPTCTAGGAQFAEEAIVNADGTLKNVFVSIKQGLEGKTFEVPRTPVLLDQKGCRYEPHVFGVQAGQPVEMINSDATLHNVHGLPGKSKEFNIGMPIEGMRIKRVLETPDEMVKFKCDVHPWMAAYAGVLSHPFYAVTGDRGVFELKDLPAGTYVVEAWHEKYGIKTQTVILEEGAEASVEFAFQA